MSVSPSYSREGWTDREPGAFAVVIGVSRYDHLPGGDGRPARDNYGLGQLAVSALTAYRFYEWLLDSYRCDGVPLARCWLALSPTPAEAAREPALNDYPRATFAACEQAIIAWFATMRDLPPDTAGASKALFFFSGHGLELYRDEHVLLPCDYLEPDGDNPNRALRTQNLRHGLAGLSVPSQHFFVDSCRNDHSRLRACGIDLRGIRVLREDGTVASNNTVASPIVYAVAAGDRAYQPSDVCDAQGTEQRTLFGGALLDGLDRPPDTILTMEHGIPQVELYQLTGFMSRRIAAALAGNRVTAGRPMSIGGGLPPPPNAVVDVDDPKGQWEMPPPVEYSRASVTSRLTLPATGWQNLDANTLASDFIGGDQELAELWQQHRLSTMDDRPVRHELESVSRDGAGTRVLRVRIPDANRPIIWRSDDGQRAIECRLPALGPNPLLRLELAWTDGWRLAVCVDGDSPGLVGHAATVWQSFADGDLYGALRETSHLVESVTSGESASAFPALVAMLVQLRMEPAPTVRLPQWLVRHPAWPDFRILDTECKLRSADDGETIALLANAASTGFRVPYAAETLGYAIGHIRDAADRPDSPPTVVAAEQAIVDLRPGSGFFCVMSPTNTAVPS